jgi:hypothetical protein
LAAEAAVKDCVLSFGGIPFAEHGIGPSAPLAFRKKRFESLRTSLQVCFCEFVNELENAL